MREGFISRVLGRHEKVDKQVLLDCLLEVAEERDLLSLIFDNMIEGVLVFDEREALRFANRRAGDLLDFSPEQCLFREMDTFLGDEEIAGPLRRSLRSGEGIKDLEVLLLVRNKPMAFLLEIAPFSDQEERFGGVLVFILDITKEKRAEAQQVETKRLSALASLSASLAHEIRNPLNSMAIHAQILKRKLVDEKRKELLRPVEIIHEEIQNLNEKLTGFLDAARPRQPQFAPVSVHELLEETLTLMRPELEAAGIEPEYYPPTVHTTVFADRIDLRKAFVNMIKNSLEAMKDGGRLVIRIHVDNDTVLITIRDTGSGIDMETLDRIFELGFTTKDIGSGLGLAQVERCIREHFGRIEVQSEPGKGTLFRIRLPVFTQGQRLIAMGPAPVEAGEGEAGAP